jgi:NAD(P)-dependent dehydrogenase (short-subunit alcohol dehydrogenase family)
MDPGLSQRVAAMTGASSGLGLVIARGGAGHARVARTASGRREPARARVVDPDRPVGTPRGIAAAGTFLASERASFITGAACKWMADRSPG